MQQLRARNKAILESSQNWLRKWQSRKAFLLLKGKLRVPYGEQRGSNENLNGLIREYLPKGKSLAHVTQADATRVAIILNRPARHGPIHSPFRR